MRPIKYRDLIKKLRSAGFVLDRHAPGSHEIWWNMETRKTCVVPHHLEIAPGTVKNMLHQMEITEKEFSNL